jgi:hypothetical protein
MRWSRWKLELAKPTLEQHKDFRLTVSREIPPCGVTRN